MDSIRIDELTFAYDADDPEGFRAGMARLGPRLGAEQTGVTIYELPPGQAICPYHYEYGEEEWVLVLDGRPSVRTPDGVEELAPGALMLFPRGPRGAHQVRNDGDAPARVAMLSNVVLPTATAYPDSGKVGVYTGDADEDLIAERSSGVDYYRGEA
ncbi:MAG: cupin domain-containing protein [Conexibacter sp.]